MGYKVADDKGEWKEEEREGGKLDRGEGRKEREGQERKEGSRETQGGQGRKGGRRKGKGRRQGGKGWGMGIKIEGRVERVGNREKR